MRLVSERPWAMVLPDLIVTGGTVLTLVPGEPPLEGAAVWIKGPRILAVDPTGTVPPEGTCRRIDATGGIVLPGLVNAHNHAAMALLRGYADDLPLERWLFERIFPAEARHVDPDFVYWGTLLACFEMIQSGTTCFADGYFFEDAAAQAVERSGMRALLAQGVIDFPAPGVPDPADNVARAQAFLERWLGRCTRITPGVFCHSPVTCSPRTLEMSNRVAEQYGVPLQLHLSETAGEVATVRERFGRRPVAFLEDLGLLGPRLLAAHAVHLVDAEIELLAQYGVKVAHVPESNMQLASGIAPVGRMLAGGCRVALGTDGCASNNNLDLWETMDTAAKMDKVSSGDPTAMKAREVLTMATAWGAAALGLDAEIGTLAAGKRADLIVVDLDRPHLQPHYDPYSALVYSAKGSDVRDVLVDGRVLMRDRRVTALDTEVIMDNARRWGRRIMQAR